MTTATTNESMIHEKFCYGETEHAHYEKHGFFIFDHFLTDKALEQCRQHVDRMISQCQEGFPVVEMMSTHQLDERWFWDLATDPKLLDMVERQIGPNIILWHTDLLNKPSKTGIEVPWHQDSPYWDVVGNHAGAIWIPLDDVDTNNGTMSLLPGWHTKGTLPRLLEKGKFFDQSINPKALPYNIDELKVIYKFRAGQMAIHNPMIPHGSTPNRSDRWRRLVSMRYIAADGELGDKMYRDYRSGELFPRQFYLVRGEDIKNYGLSHSPIESCER